LYNLKNFVVNIDLSMINYHYVKKKWIKYQKVNCEIEPRQGQKYRFKLYN